MAVRRLRKRARRVPLRPLALRHCHAVLERHVLHSRHIRHREKIRCASSGPTGSECNTYTACQLPRECDFHSGAALSVIPSPPSYIAPVIAIFGGWGSQYRSDSNISVYLLLSLELYLVCCIDCLMLPGTLLRYLSDLWLVAPPGPFPNITDPSNQMTSSTGSSVVASTTSAALSTTSRINTIASSTADPSGRKICSSRQSSIVRCRSLCAVIPLPFEFDPMTGHMIIEGYETRFTLKPLIVRDLPFVRSPFWFSPSRGPVPRSRYPGRCGCSI